MIKLTPIELQSILNAALLEITRNPKYYTKTEPKVKKLIKWVYSIKWDEPNTECIFIDEVPF